MRVFINTIFVNKYVAETFDYAHKAVHKFYGVFFLPVIA